MPTGIMRLEILMIKCDEPMKRSKERATPFWEMRSVKWECNGRCEQCVCGMKKNKDGNWIHNKLGKESKDE